MERACLAYHWNNQSNWVCQNGSLSKKKKVLQLSHWVSDMYSLSLHTLYLISTQSCSEMYLQGQQCIFKSRGGGRAFQVYSLGKWAFCEPGRMYHVTLNWTDDILHISRYCVSNHCPLIHKQDTIASLVALRTLCSLTHAQAITANTLVLNGS